MAKYCLPIIAASFHEIRERIHEANEQFDLFEVWLDYIDSVDYEELRALCESHNERLIFVLRRMRLEPIRMPLSERAAILSLLGKYQCLVDLDIVTQEEEIIEAERIELSRVILSYHNYERTPDNESLEGFVQSMTEHAPALYKIATYCQREMDAVRLLSLSLSLRERGYRCIVLGMGPFGTLTRIFGTLWANEIIFAPTSREAASAPGQLSRDDLSSIMEVLIKHSEEHNGR